MVSSELFIQMWNEASKKGLCHSDLAEVLGCSRQAICSRAQYLRNKGTLLAPLASGKRQGGLRAAATNKQRYGDSFYAIIGAKGGKAGKTGGFYANRELARIAGAKGGSVSRRSKKTRVTEIKDNNFWDSEDE